MTRWMTAVAISLGLLAPMVTTAQTPGLVGFHGYLTDLAGNPVDAPEGRTFMVSIYHEADGGDAFWVDEFVDRPVVDGVFRILLGSGNHPVPAAQFDGGVKYLGIQVDGGPELSPRLQLVTVPYSLRSAEADVAAVAQSANQLGGVAASSYARKADLTKYDGFDAQIAALQAKVTSLESQLQNPTCPDSCAVGEVGCSEDFSERWACEKAAGEACPTRTFVECAGQNACHLGECTCKPAFQNVCIGDSAWVADSCGQPEQLLGDCGEGGCHAGQCTSWNLETPLALDGMNDLYVVGGHLYAVGNAGRALHYDGTRWTRMSTGTALDLYGVWGYSEAGKNKLYAVGANGKMLFYDGSKWSTVVTGSYHTLREVFGLSASNVIAVGDAGTVLRWNGTTWVRVTWNTETQPWHSTSFHSVWAHSSSQIWVGGAGGTIIHNDGTSWEQQSTPGGTGAVGSLWGVSADSVWAAAGSKILKLQAGEWVDDFTPESGASFNAIWVQIQGNVSFYAVANDGVVYTFDGAGWTKQEVVSTQMGSADFTGVMGGSGAPGNGVWLIAQDGKVAYRDPSEKWVFPTIVKAVTGLYAVAGQANQQFAVGTDCLALRFEDGEWVRATVDGTCASGTTDFRAIWGDGTTGTLIAVGDNGLYKTWSGTSWVDGQGPSGSNNRDIWGLDANNIFVVQPEGTWVWNGVSWQPTGGGGGVAGAGTSITSFHVVDTSGNVHSFDGSEWTTRQLTTDALRDVRVRGSEIWVVGDNGTVFMHDGTDWIDRSIPDDVLRNSALSTVWATALSPVYVAAGAGAIYEWDGTSWSAQSTFPPVNHHVLFGTGPSNVLLGGDGAIFRHD